MTVRSTDSCALSFDSEKRYGARDVLLDAADANVQPLRDLGVTESVQPMHEEHLSHSRVRPIECFLHPFQAFLGRENLLGRGRKVDEIQLVQGLVKVDPRASMRVHGEIQDRACEESLWVAHLTAIAGIGVQAEHGFLHEILRVRKVVYPTLEQGPESAGDRAHGPT